MQKYYIYFVVISVFLKIILLILSFITCFLSELKYVVLSQQVYHMLFLSSILFRIPNFCLGVDIAAHHH